MKKIITCILAILANTVYICQAQNAVVKLLPENGATDVNIDTHLTLTMSDDAIVGQKGFVSVYDKQTGKLVDRLDMSSRQDLQRGSRRILRHNTRLYLIFISRNRSQTVTPRLALRLA